MEKSVTKGLSTNLVFNTGLKWFSGATLWMFQNRKWHNYKPNFEKFSATWAISYRINNYFLMLITLETYGPMRLPLLGDLDPGENIPQLEYSKHSIYVQ
jgi:outer membrane receptor for ferrienterochelin and colicins